MANLTNPGGNDTLAALHYVPRRGVSLQDVRLCIIRYYSSEKVNAGRRSWRALKQTPNTISSDCDRLSCRVAGYVIDMYE